MATAGDRGKRGARQPDVTLERDALHLRISHRRHELVQRSNPRRRPEPVAELIREVRAGLDDHRGGSPNAVPDASANRTYTNDAFGGTILSPSARRTSTAGRWPGR